MIDIPEENMKRYFDFINERHAIYLRRERGDEWPWTEDEILKTYKFTNIFRELDTGTVHCREFIREPWAQDRELFFNIASYRLYNLIGTQKELGYILKYDVSKYVDMVYKRKERGEQVFTGAHMLTGTLGGDKIHQVFEICLGTLWKNRRLLEPKPGDTLEEAFKRLHGHNPGYGAFIAYEVITDLRWTRYLEDATDIMSWANPGPGCQRGVNRILGNQVGNRRMNGVRTDTSTYPAKYEYLEYMRMLLTASPFYLADWVPEMEMRDIEHSLCEFDKYERARLNEGKPRSRYTPPHMR